MKELPKYNNVDVRFEEGYRVPTNLVVERYEFGSAGFLREHRADGSVVHYPPHAIRHVIETPVTEENRCTFLWPPLSDVGCPHSGMDHQCAGRLRGHNMSEDLLAAVHKCPCGSQYDVNAAPGKQVSEPSGPPPVDVQRNRVAIACAYEWGSDCVEAVNDDRYDPQRRHACVIEKDRHVAGSVSGMIHICRCEKTRGVVPVVDAGRPILRRDPRT